MKNKFISLICALSMIATMFASFTVVNAEGTPAVTATATKNKDNTVTLKVSYDGFTAVSALQFDIPIDTTAFEELTDKNAVVVDAAFSGVTSNPAGSKYSFVWYSTDPVAGSGDAVTITLTLKDGVAVPEEIALSGVKVADETAEGTVKYGGTNTPLTVNNAVVIDPDAPAPAKPRPEGNDEPAPAVPEVVEGPQVVAEATLGKDEKTVTVKISYKEFTAVSALQFDIPIDTTVFEELTDKENVVVDAAFSGVTSNPAGSKYSFVWYSTDPVAGSGDAVTLTLTLKDDATLPQTITVSGAKVADETAEGTVKYGGTNEPLGIVNAVVKAASTDNFTKKDVALKGNIDVTKIGDDDAETNSPYYMVVTATKNGGKDEAVYGTDYKAYYNGIELTKGQLTNYLSGKYGSVKDAANGITFSYNNGVSIAVELNKDGVKTPLATSELPSAGKTPATPKPSKPSIGVTVKPTTVYVGDSVTVTAKITNPKADGVLTVAPTDESYDYVAFSGIKSEVAEDNKSATTTFKAVAKGTNAIVLNYKYDYTDENNEAQSVTFEKKITIKEKTTDNGGSGSSSGSSTTSGGTGPIANANNSTVTNPYGPSMFKDLGDAPWASEAITMLASKNIVSGRDENTFDPNANITRAEYCQILVGAIGKSAEYADASFDDVPTDAWFYHAVAVASKYGIVSGYGDGNFGPYDLITRQDMALMTQRAAEAVGKNLTAVSDSSFTDADQISEYAQDAVYTLANAGIINGMGDGTFAPKANATRAQASVIIYTTFVK